MTKFFWDTLYTYAKEEGRKTRVTRKKISETNFLEPVTMSGGSSRASSPTSIATKHFLGDLVDSACLNTEELQINHTSQVGQFNFC